jgi:hypothetical protein
MGQLLSTGPDTALALFGVPFVPLRRGPLKPRRLLTYIHSKLFDEQRVQGFKPSHLRCLDRHWTHAEGTVMRSLLWSGRVEVDASEGCRSFCGSPSELGEVEELAVVGLSRGAGTWTWAWTGTGTSATAAVAVAGSIVRGRRRGVRRPRQRRPREYAGWVEECAAGRQAPALVGSNNE